MADGVAATAVWQIRIRPNWDWVGMTGEHGADAEGLPIAHGYNCLVDQTGTGWGWYYLFRMF